MSVQLCDLSHTVTLPHPIMDRRILIIFRVTCPLAGGASWLAIPCSNNMVSPSSRLMKGLVPQNPWLPPLWEAPSDSVT